MLSSYFVGLKDTKWPWQGTKWTAGDLTIRFDPTW